ncbi:Mobile element protein [Candidatus Enterovibrio escicola]|uniref:Mobile element protein n=1 Tax=Candidatus Enterovibrio escicola TaxID=1927127 RepID=A0A2A5T180_9GAMM|nr:transposase [Candidatus Enterovibrio escacola]PCS21923.1 Mobile element protein [Candidatus Enterovibrio escacola]
MEYCEDGHPRNKPSRLSISEVIKIIVSLHQSSFHGFKKYYTQFICRHLTGEFHDLVSSTRVFKLMQSALVPLCSYLTSRQTKLAGIVFVYSTKLQVYHNLRIPRHQVFEGRVKRDKEIMGGFYALNFLISSTIKEVSFL